MGQRPNLLLSGSSEDHTHPFLDPIGYRKDGRPIFMIMGAEDDDDDDDDSTSGATVPIGRYLKVRNRMQAADRRASAAEARVAELEPVAQKVVELEKKVESDAEQIKKLRLDNAFLTSDIEWVDPEAALRLADLSEVEVKDDGTVKGLEDALKALAEKKPYLVKKKEEENGGKNGGKGKNKSDEDEDDDESDEDEDDEAEEQEEEGASGTNDNSSSGAQGGASGTSTGTGKRRRRSNGPTDEELLKRYRI